VRRKTGQLVGNFFYLSHIGTHRALDRNSTTFVYFFWLWERQGLMQKKYQREQEQEVRNSASRKRQKVVIQLNEKKKK
jgi:hypothetical protein